MGSGTDLDLDLQVREAPGELAVVQADLETGEDTDGFGFTTSPGATVRVSALLYDPGFGWSDDAELAARFETEDWVGRTVDVTNSVLQGHSRRTP